MRKIKFRGRDACGKLHYGDLWQRTDGMILFDHDEHVWQRVHPESIAQFVGYDKDGREVYEGDYVYVRTNRGNITFKPATMIDIHLVHTYKLKEASDNA